MKKKIIAIVLVVLMIVGNSFMALAGTPDGTTSIGGTDGKKATEFDDTNNNDTCNVTGKYSGTKITVYRVDITWGAMVATYSAYDQWDPSTLSYISDGGGNTSDWNVSGGTVKAVNYSNAQVTIGLQCNVDKNVVGATAIDSEVASVTGSFTGATKGVYNDLIKPTLESAEGKTNATLDEETWTLDLDGTPTKTFSSSGETVATVKVTIS